MVEKDNSEEHEANGKGNVSLMEDFNVMGNKGRFSQAFDTMVKTCKNIVGYFKKFGVASTLFSLMK